MTVGAPPPPPPSLPRHLSAAGGRRISGLLLALGVALAGCRTGDEWIYDKPRVTPAQLDRDLTQCRQLTLPTGPLAFPALTGPDRDAFNACMQKRGYTATRP